MITYTALATALIANNTAVAAAAGGGAITASTVSGLAELLQILASNKGLGTPPLLKSKNAKVEMNPQ